MSSLLLLITIVSRLLVCVSSSGVIQLDIPPSPAIAAASGLVSDYLSPNLASFSIEFSYLVEFFGNKSNPNTLSLQALQNIEQRIGVPVSIRPGGITVSVFMIFWIPFVLLTIISIVTVPYLIPLLPHLHE
jgi:hypothetical protein